MLERCSALIPADLDPPVLMFVTSPHFAAIVAEARLLVKGPVLPNPANCKEFMVGKNLIVANSGSEDQDAVNIANRLEAERSHFQWRRDNLRTS